MTGVLFSEEELSEELLAGVVFPLLLQATNEKAMHAVRVKVTNFFIFISPKLFFLLLQNQYFLFSVSVALFVSTETVF
jgi:hypothetical protein